MFDGTLAGTGDGILRFNGATLSIPTGKAASLDFASGIFQWESGRFTIPGGLTNLNQMMVTTAADHDTSLRLRNLHGRRRSHL